MQLALIHCLKKQASWTKKALSQKAKLSEEQTQAVIKQLIALGARISLGSTINCQTDWLNVQTIHQHLPDGQHMPHCYLFNTVPSSNSTLMHLAQTYREKAALCLSEHQSHGRGQHNNRWVSPLGSNLYFSLLHPFRQQDALTPMSEQVAHWVSQAIKDYGIDAELTIKAPNDILHQDKKLCGILIETLVRPKHSAIVIGIGINLNMSMTNISPPIDQPWTDLASISGKPIDRNRFCACLMSVLLKQLSQTKTTN